LNKIIDFNDRFFVYIAFELINNYTSYNNFSEGSFFMPHSVYKIEVKDQT